VRLVTWNIRSGHGLDDVCDLGRVAALLAELQPDVVALQEVDAYQSRSGGLAQWRELGRDLGLAAFFGPNEWRLFGRPPQPEMAGGGTPQPPRRPQYGNALLTRLPVTAAENFLLFYRAHGEGYKEQRGCLLVEAGGVAWLCTHWGLHPEERLRQGQELAALVQGQGGRPAVVLGDLNAAPTDPELQPLQALLRDAGAGAGPSFPADRPVQRIDYCLVPPAWRVLEARVVPTTASDHRPLLVVAEPDGQ